jgi:hypothetical protein
MVVKNRIIFSVTTYAKETSCLEEDDIETQGEGLKCAASGL